MLMRCTVVYIASVLRVLFCVCCAGASSREQPRSAFCWSPGTARWGTGVFLGVLRRSCAALRLSPRAVNIARAGFFSVLSSRSSSPRTRAPFSGPGRRDWYAYGATYIPDLRSYAGGPNRTVTRTRARGAFLGSLGGPVSVRVGGSRSRWVANLPMGEPGGASSRRA